MTASRPRHLGTRSGHRSSGAATAAMLAAILAILIARAFFGFDWTDESYYAANAYRIVRGDALFVDMWNFDQLSALVCAPLVWAFTQLNGGTQGILLFLRLSYALICWAVFVLTYMALKEEVGPLWALVASAPAALTANPFTLSYNSVRMLTYYATCALLVLARRAPAGSKSRFARLVAAGFAYAVGTVAYPTSILTLPVVLLWAARDPELGGRGAARTLAPCLVGGGACVALVVGFICVNSSLAAVAQNWQRLLYNRENHALIDMFLQVGAMLGRVRLGCAAAACVLGALACRMRATGPHARALAVADVAFWLMVASVPVLECVGQLPALSGAAIQYRVFLSIACVGPSIFVWRGRRRHVSMWLYALGLLGCVVVYLSSINNGPAYYVYPSALSATAVMWYAASLSEGSESGALAAAGDGIASGHGSAGDKFSEGLIRRLSVATFVVTIAFAGLSSLGYVYRDAPIPELDQALVSGPAAGLRTTSARAAQYEDTLATIETYVDPQGSVLFVKLLPFGYLCTDARVAAPSTWTAELDSERLEDYYTQNPGRAPSTIYIVGPSYGFAGKNDDVVIDDYFARYLDEHMELVADVPAGRVYGLRK